MVAHQQEDSLSREAWVTITANCRKPICSHAHPMISLEFSPPCSNLRELDFIVTLGNRACYSLVQISYIDQSVRMSKSFPKCHVGLPNLAFWHMIGTSPCHLTVRNEFSPSSSSLGDVNDHVHNGTFQLSLLRPTAQDCWPWTPSCNWTDTMPTMLYLLALMLAVGNVFPWPLLFRRSDNTWFPLHLIYSLYFPSK